jgi:5'-methylthioinosine phosphorylase
MRIGVIGGTGLNSLNGLEILRSHAVDTPYGRPSMAIEEGVYAGKSLFFLHRHGGSGQPVPPHLLNYRANIWALAELGVNGIVAINAVGAINPAMQPGSLVVPDQLIDYSWGREHSFDDGSSGSLLHVDFSEPFDAGLRAALLLAAELGDVPRHDGATLAVVQGPRLETAAEVRRLARDGCDLVGMTAMPEASLARELGLAYASLCMVVNAAAGLAPAPITLEAMRATLIHETALVGRVLEQFIPAHANAQSDESL